MHVKRGIFDDAYYDYSLQMWRKPHFVVDPPSPKKKKPRQRPGSSARRSLNLRRVVFVRDKFSCRDCPAVFPHPDPYRGEPIRGLSIGHIVPRSQGGNWHEDNLIAQCIDCNRKLGAQMWRQGWRGSDATIGS